MSSLNALQKAGVIPLAIGGEDWQETVAFDHVVLAAGGASFYDSVMSGDLDAIGSETMVDAFAKFAAIREFTDEEKRGEAGMTPIISLCQVKLRTFSWVPGQPVAMVRWKKAKIGLVD